MEAWQERGEKTLVDVPTSSEEAVKSKQDVLPMSGDRLAVVQLPELAPGAPEICQPLGRIACAGCPFLKLCQPDEESEFIAFEETGAGLIEPSPSAPSGVPASLTNKDAPQPLDRAIEAESLEVMFKKIPRLKEKPVVKMPNINRRTEVIANVVTPQPAHNLNIKPLSESGPSFKTVNKKIKQRYTPNSAKKVFRPNNKITPQAPVQQTLMSSLKSIKRLETKPLVNNQSGLRRQMPKKPYLEEGVDHLVVQPAANPTEKTVNESLHSKLEKPIATTVEVVAQVEAKQPAKELVVENLNFTAAAAPKARPYLELLLSDEVEAVTTRGYIKKKKLRRTTSRPKEEKPLSKRQNFQSSLGSPKANLKNKKSFSALQSLEKTGRLKEEDNQAKELIKNLPSNAVFKNNPPLQHPQHPSAQNLKKELVSVPDILPKIEEEKETRYKNNPEDDTTAKPSRAPAIKLEQISAKAPTVSYDESLLSHINNLTKSLMRGEQQNNNLAEPQEDTRLMATGNYYHDIFMINESLIGDEPSSHGAYAPVHTLKRLLGAISIGLYNKVYG